MIIGRIIARTHIRTGNASGALVGFMAGVRGSDIALARRVIGC